MLINFIGVLCMVEGNSSYFKRIKIVTVAQKHSFKSLQIQCSNVEVVSQHFYGNRTMKVKKYVGTSGKHVIVGFVCYLTTRSLLIGKLEFC